VGNITRYFLMTVFALAFLSCDRTERGNGNVPLPQDADRAIGQVVDMAEEGGLNETVRQVVDEPELSQAVAEEAERTIGMTLIPSVEPELLRNVMPNSWHRLERLTEDEERDFLRENIDALLEIEEMQRRRSVSNDWYWREYFSVYRQQVGSDTFFRIIATSTDAPNFLSRVVSFSQFLIHWNTFLIDAEYGQMGATQFGWVIGFSSLDIISSGDGAKAVMVTTVSVSGVDRDDPNDWSINTPRRNGQLFGGNWSTYYFLRDLLDGIRSSLIITASNSLVDPDSPLRHSLQNAFDGDPATSFIANDENDFMRIMFSRADLPISKLAVINGHALNPISYNNFNRIRIFTSLGNEKMLNDGVLSHQFMIENAALSFWVREVYEGDIYNMTALAELNFLTEKGWLFGDIYE